MATIIKGSTKRGERMFTDCKYYEGYYLTDVYSRPSQEKIDAWNDCFNEFLDTEESSGFCIVSHNTFQFKVRWFGLYDGEEALYIKTATNSYIVLLDK